jgi:HNH endonuclease
MPEAERQCRKCGCTDEQKCPGGCRWVENDLCSQCSRKVLKSSLKTRPEFIQLRKNNAEVDSMYLLYLHGANGKTYSLADVGKAFGKTRQAVYDQFRCRGFKRRSPTIGALRVFDGQRYRARKNGDFRATSGTRRSLHVAVWEKANGPLPKGHGIIHRDGDRGNNELENLQLLTVSEISLRSPKLNQFTSPNGSMKRPGEKDLPEWQRNLRREIYRAENSNTSQ